MTIYTNPAGMVSSGFQVYDISSGVIVGRNLVEGTNVTILNANGIGAAPVISAMVGTPIFAYTETAVTPYVVNVGDYIIGIDCSGAIKTVHLPNAPTSTGTSYIIKDYTGSAGANPISVTTPGGAVLIDGAATYTMNVAYSSITVVWSGAAYRVL